MPGFDRDSMSCLSTPHLRSRNLWQHLDGFVSDKSLENKVMIHKEKIKKKTKGLGIYYLFSGFIFGISGTSLAARGKAPSSRLSGLGGYRDLRGPEGPEVPIGLAMYQLRLQLATMNKKWGTSGWPASISMVNKLLKWV